MLGFRLSMARERAMHDSSTSIPNPGGVTGVVAAYPGKVTDSSVASIESTVATIEST